MKERGREEGERGREREREISMLLTPVFHYHTMDAFRSSLSLQVYIYIYYIYSLEEGPPFGEWWWLAYGSIEQEHTLQVTKTAEFKSLFAQRRMFS